jgi:hypothetical protein
MRTNALTRAPFNARDRQRLQRMVRPGDPVPLLQRGGLNERIGAILGPNALKDPKNPKDQADFLMRLAADFVPVRTRDDDDGRPDDADPNDGDDSDDDNATGGRGVREGLGFDLTPIPVPELVPYTRRAAHRRHRPVPRRHGLSQCARPLCQFRPQHRDDAPRCDGLLCYGRDGPGRRL